VRVCRLNFFSDFAFENFLAANTYATIVKMAISRSRHDSLFRPAAIENIKIIC